MKPMSKRMLFVIMIPMVLAACGPQNMRPMSAKNAREGQTESLRNREPNFPSNNFTKPAQFSGDATTNQAPAGPTAYQATPVQNPVIDVPQATVQATLPNTQMGPFSPGVPYFCNPYRTPMNIIYSASACKPFLSQVNSWVAPAIANQGIAPSIVPWPPTGGGYDSDAIRPFEDLRDHRRGHHHKKHHNDDDDDHRNKNDDDDNHSHHRRHGKKH